MTKELPRIIKVELMAEPSIKVVAGVSVVALSKPCWMDPIINFFAKDWVPDDEKEAGKVHQVVARY